MNEKLLFKCLLHSSPLPSFELKEDECTNWNTKYPPIVDMLIVSEENVDIIPHDYYVVLNQSSESSPKGSISYCHKKKGYLCIKRYPILYELIFRSYGKSYISHLQFFPKQQVQEATENGYFIVKQYPECEMVNFSHSKEEFYLGYGSITIFNGIE